jgi:hypothetical protein
MTIVIADTSPINYLVLIGEIGILPRLYFRIVIPEDVFAELTDEGAPLEVREWAAQCPRRVEIRVAPDRDTSLMELDAGEGAAIALAELEDEVLLLIDESAGRLEATQGHSEHGNAGCAACGSDCGLPGFTSGLAALVGYEFPDIKTASRDERYAGLLRLAC